MELSILSSLLVCLRATFIIWGEAAQLPLPQKRIAKNNRSEGGVARRDAVSGGQAPKPLEIFPVASAGYGGYVR